MTRSGLSKHLSIAWDLKLHEEFRMENNIGSETRAPLETKGQDGTKRWGGMHMFLCFGIVTCASLSFMKFPERVCTSSSCCVFIWLSCSSDNTDRSMLCCCWPPAMVLAWASTKVCSNKFAAQQDRKLSYVVRTTVRPCQSPLPDFFVQIGRICVLAR